MTLVAPGVVPVNSFVQAQTATEESGLKSMEKDETMGSLDMEYPEGGVPAYLTVAGSALGLNQLKWHSQSTISWIGSAGIAVIYAGGVRYEILAGALIYLLGVYTLSISKNFYTIFLSNAILARVSTIMTRYRRRRSRESLCLGLVQ
ncbi:hypothetical protein T439DRAFT_354099 [Meredithblackwellia eburnea MCA 4105]